MPILCSMCSSVFMVSNKHHRDFSTEGNIQNGLNLSQYFIYFKFKRVDGLNVDTADRSNSSFSPLVEF